MGKGLMGWSLVGKNTTRTKNKGSTCMGPLGKGDSKATKKERASESKIKFGSNE